MTSVQEMKEQKFIDWGNGEPCPICNKLFDKVDFQHLIDEHWDIVKNILF